MRRSIAALAALLLAVSVGSCAPELRPLVVGEDSCRFCRMTIDDVRFGAMLVTRRGRIETFDSIECLAAYVGTLAVADRPQSLWVADFERPTRWVDVAQARFLHRSSLRSPMGRELAAIGSAAPSDALQRRYGGRVLSWTDVLALAERERFTPGATVPHS